MPKKRSALRHQHPYIRRKPHPANVLETLQDLQARLPSCNILRPVDKSFPDAAGTVLVRQLQTVRPGRFAYSILAHALPAPSELGPFDAYQGLVYVPDVITWVFPLFPTQETPATWAGSFTESTLNPLPAGVAQVRPYNTETNATGSAILQGTLG